MRGWGDAHASSTCTRVLAAAPAPLPTSVVAKIRQGQRRDLLSILRGRTCHLHFFGRGSSQFVSIGFVRAVPLRCYSTAFAQVLLLSRNRNCARPETCKGIEGRTANIQDFASSRCCSKKRHAINWWRERSARTERAGDSDPPPRTPPPAIDCNSQLGRPSPRPRTPPPVSHMRPRNFSLFPNGKSP